MLHRLLFFSVLLLSINLVTAQKITLTSQVIDGKTGKELAFANIMVLNHPIGISANEEGFFTIQIPQELSKEKLVVSYIGYKTKYIPIPTITNKPIKLIPDAVVLDEVVVSSRNKPKSVKEKIIANFKDAKCVTLHSMAPFGNTGKLWIPYRGIQPSIEAVFFKNKSRSKKTTWLKQVDVYLKKFNDGAATFHLRIFENDTVTNTPGKDLTTEPVYGKLEKNKERVVIDMQNFNIEIPKSGLYIGVEVLVTEKNKQTYINDVDVEAINYSPFMNFVPTKKKDEYYWLYSGGKWEKKNRQVYNEGSGKTKFYRPAVSITIEE